MASVQASESITVEDIVKHLWSRLWLLLLVPPVLLVAAYLGIRYFGGETYRSSAILMVRTTANQFRDQNRLDPIDPPVYEGLLKNDALLLDVVTATRKKFGSAFGNSKFEWIKSAFTVKSVTTRDTSVTTTYSPMIELSVEGGSAEVARFMADTWVTLAIERYGNLQSSEADATAKATQRRFEGVSTKVAELRKNRFEFERQLRDVETLLRAKYRVLARDPVVLSDVAEGSQSARLNPNAPPPEFADFKLSLDSGSSGAGPIWETKSLGLVEERAALELRIAELEATPSKAAEAGPLKARIVAIDDLMTRTKTEINELGKRLVEVQTGLEQMKDELALAQAARQEMSRVAAVASMTGSDFNDPSEPGASSDFRRIADPITPEFRVKPSRMLIAAASAVAGAVLLIFLLVAELYLRRTVLGAN